MCEKILEEIRSLRKEVLSLKTCTEKKAVPFYKEPIRKVLEENFANKKFTFEYECNYRTVCELANIDFGDNPKLKAIQAYVDDRLTRLRSELATRIRQQLARRYTSITERSVFITMYPSTRRAKGEKIVSFTEKQKEEWKDQILEDLQLSSDSSSEEAVTTMAQKCKFPESTTSDLAFMMAYLWDILSVEREHEASYKRYKEMLEDGESQ